MESSIVNRDNILNEKKYFWSPGVRWEKINDTLKIEIFTYRENFAELFPKFYYIVQKGADINKLLEEFSDVEPRVLNAFVTDLIKKRVLVSTIISPQEAFYPQSYLFKNEYSEKIRYDAEELNKFKKKQLNRNLHSDAEAKIPLENCKMPYDIDNRRTYRSFDQTKKISFTSLSCLLSVFKQIRDGDSIRYYYASAGGLYPIDIFVYIKKDRIDGFEQGLYYYNPIQNDLRLVDQSFVIPKEAHYFTNQSIFNDSAMSIFFIYNAEATMPKYGGMGYFYSAIDCGIMVSSLTTVAEIQGIGVCSIGEMDFNKISKFFKLNDNQVFIHTVEVGLKPVEEDKRTFNY